MKRRVRVAIVLVFSVAIGAIGYDIAYHYLASGRLAPQVASRLAQLYGGRVTVDGVDLGLHQSDIRGLRLYEAETQNAEPWAIAPEVRADVSLWDLARGKVEPRRITLINADVTLHFDRAGTLLTQIPHSKSGGEPWPEVVLQGGQLTLQQDGRPAMLVHGIQATLRPEGSRLVLDGTVQDPYWQNWTLAGAVDRQTWAVETNLKSDGVVHVTQAMLDRLPLVSPSVWREVQVEGDTPVDFTVRVLPDDQKSHYRIVLDPRATTVHVAALDLTAHAAHGGLVIDDGIVELKKVEGQVADGTLTFSGKLDFLSTPDRLTFQAQASGLNVSALPASWLNKLPAGVQGRLSGSADLQVRIDHAGPHTSGSGSAIIREARVAGLPAEPIHLRLTSDGGHGYRFVSQLPTPVRPVGIDTRAALVLVALQGGESQTLSWPGWLVEQTLDGTQILLGSIEQASNRVLTALQTVFPSKPMPGAPPQALQINLAMNQVRLEALLHNLNIALPFPLTGRLSFRVRVAFPVNNPGDARAYHVAGSATLADANIDGLALQQVELRLLYARGVLHLQQLKGTVPGADHNSAGTFAGKAEVPLFPAGNLTAELTLQQLALQRLLHVVPAGAPPAEGTMSGSVRLRVPLNKLHDLTAWQATGAVQAQQLVAFGWTIQKAQFDWTTQRNEIKLSNIRGTLYQGTVRGTASLPLEANTTGHLDLDFDNVDVGALEKAVPSVPVPLQGQASGSIQATLSAARPGQARTVSARLDLKATQLRVQGIPTSRLTGTIDFAPGKARYHLEGHALGGTFTLEGAIPPSAQPPAGEKRGRLDIHGAQLGQLWTAYPWLHSLLPLRGNFDLALAFDGVGPQGLPAGSGTAVLHRLRWSGVALADTIRANLVMDDGELRLADLGGTVAQGTLRGTVAANLYNGDRSWFNIAVDNGQADALLAPWPALAAHVAGSLSVRLRGRLGRTSSGTGEADLTNARAWGLAVTQWRLPLRWVVATEVGRGRVTVQASTAQLAHGRLTGHARLGWGLGTRVRVRANFFQLDVQSILRHLDSSGPTGSGLLSGSLAVDGTDVRSMDAVTGLIEARLTGAQAYQYPVLRQLAPYTGGDSNASLGNGRLRARLTHGVVRVERFSLTVRQVPLYMRGTVTDTGRLDLDVTINRRSRRNPVLAGLLSQSSGSAQPLPLTLLSQATRLIAAQLVHLRVTGTVSNPLIQVLPPPILSDSMLRFLLRPGG